MEETMNLFWRQTRTPQLREQEKENNVTHAFLLLLLKNQTILDILLNKLKMSSVKKTSKRVFFQVTKKQKARTLECKNKYLLFIKSKFNEQEVKSKELSQKKVDIPDGLIIDDNTAILIEAKVSSIKSDSQITRYNNTYFNGEGKIINTTWEDIHAYISSTSSDKNNEITADFLLNEFKKYLEVIHLSGFSGIQFFDTSELYTTEDASYILKQLMRELRDKEWFLKHSFKTGDRPKVNAWDYWYYEDIKGLNPRGFPHYSVYIFEEFFAVDCLFHKKELKMILKDERLFEKFAAILAELSQSPDYYFRAIHYRLLHNKEKARARQGDSYTDFDLFFQLRKFIKKHKADWKDHLRKYLSLVIKEDPKQFSIMKKAHYKDKMFSSLVYPQPCFRFIKSTIDETLHLYNLTHELYIRSKN